MKRIATILSIFISIVSVDAQVAIGKKVVSGSGLLDFAQDSAKGIILPLVESLPIGPANGTFVALKSDSSIYVRQDTLWVKLTQKGKLPTTFLNYASTDFDSTVIGARTSAASGVLVLESSNKALILPKNSNPHNSMPTPRIGTMCYDLVNKAVAFYDGIKWVYWR